MAIKYAILGLLSWQPLTGYDLKKMFVNSTYLYWSGNNNQIYKTLVQLLDEGLVNNEVRHQEKSPTKKVYFITDAGRAELKGWVVSMPEPPELRNPFLIQLAWADQLSDQELSSLLEKYEKEIEIQLLMHQEKERRGGMVPQRTKREAYLWAMISENITASYQKELDWVKKLKAELT